MNIVRDDFEQADAEPNGSSTGLINSNILTHVSELLKPLTMMVRKVETFLAPVEVLDLIFLLIGCSAVYRLWKLVKNLFGCSFFLFHRIVILYLSKVLYDSA